jgi:uncharacterized membrane protein YsdA (DUF1294 family)
MTNKLIRDYALISFSLAVGMTVFLWWRIGLDLVAAWLVAVNLTAFLIFGADKTLVDGRRPRVPKVVLLGTIILFGSLGAWFGMLVLQHKLAAEYFRQKFWLLVILQILVVLLYYFIIKPMIV